ncbi:hypothetical protein ACFO0N_17740 [Halobium salinum]|uniref:DUF7344 domain-containing protein n=1 Tax=Halobium salinum TaxID=1364940 RepID=A0ABD5PG76_9EURY|nr:hypothetical protein [Halobium salinum]
MSATQQQSTSSGERTDDHVEGRSEGAAPPAADDGEPDSGATPDEVFDVLSNRRRRYTLHYLGRRSGEVVEVRDVAEQVAAWENEKPVERVDRAERKRVHTALHQFHLPKLDDHGFVDYDSRRGRAALGETAAGLDVYLDVVSERAVPWGPYYVGLTALGITTVLGAQFGVSPFGLLQVAVWAGLALGAVLLSALVHTWYSSRTRLGVGEKPPELRA